MKNYINKIENPEIENVKGFISNGCSASIKKNGDNDLGVVFFSGECDGSGVFTTNKVKAAPVIVSQKNIKNKLRMLVVNSGNANACTGNVGISDAQYICKECEELFNVPASSVIPMSTGVIGQRLPVDKVKNGLIYLSKNIEMPNKHGFTKAIMTTDTKMKIYGVKVKTDNYEYSIVGCAKGSGMIHPNMATMLAFVFTDVKMNNKLFDKAFKESINQSFNSITVDGDTSTNDSAFLFKSNMQPMKEISSKNQDYKTFTQALNEVTLELAKKIVEDGEGATKFIQITVKGANSQEQAKQAAFSVATSSLVKTAFFGEDANWGRIICALGYSGINFDPSYVKLYFGNLLIFKNGEPAMYSEEEATSIIKEKDIKVTIDLGLKDAEWTVYTTDLSYDYVKINGSYRS